MIAVGGAIARSRYTNRPQTAILRVRAPLARRRGRRPTRPHPAMIAVGGAIAQSRFTNRPL